MTSTPVKLEPGKAKLKCDIISSVDDELVSLRRLMREECRRRLAGCVRKKQSVRKSLEAGPTLVTTHSPIGNAPCGAVGAARKKTSNVGPTALHKYRQELSEVQMEANLGRKRVPWFLARMPNRKLLVRDVRKPQPKNGGVVLTHALQSKLVSSSGNSPGRAAARTCNALQLYKKELRGFSDVYKNSFCRSSTCYRVAACRSEVAIRLIRSKSSGSVQYGTPPSKYDGKRVVFLDSKITGADNIGNAPHCPKNELFKRGSPENSRDVRGIDLTSHTPNPSPILQTQIMFSSCDYKKSELSNEVLSSSVRTGRMRPLETSIETLPFTPEEMVSSVEDNYTERNSLMKQCVSNADVSFFEVSNRDAIVSSLKSAVGHRVTAL
ncbi:unnamed protein product, partial [Trypanosoma congolense IL3000]